MLAILLQVLLYSSAFAILLSVEGSNITVEQLPTDPNFGAVVIDAETLTKFTQEQSGHPYCFIGKTCQLGG